MLLGVMATVGRPQNAAIDVQPGAVFFVGHMRRMINQIVENRKRQIIIDSRYFSIGKINKHGERRLICMCRALRSQVSFEH